MIQVEEIKLSHLSNKRSKLDTTEEWWLPKGDIEIIYINTCSIIFMFSHLYEKSHFRILKQWSIGNSQTFKQTDFQLFSSLLCLPHLLCLLSQKAGMSNMKVIEKDPAQQRAVCSHHFPGNSHQAGAAARTPVLRAQCTLSSISTIPITQCRILSSQERHTATQMVLDLDMFFHEEFTECVFFKGKKKQDSLSFKTKTNQIVNKVTMWHIKETFSTCCFLMTQYMY